MRPGIIDLREFYATPRGRIAAGTLSRTLSRMRREAPSPPNTVQASLVAYGYAVPVLTAAPADAIHLMPAAQGGCAWPSTERDSTRLCSDDQWPLPDKSAGAVLLMHALEHSTAPLALLAEAWRVLAPQGQLWVVVPNRRSLWAMGVMGALAESTPFGRGQPYSATQLRQLLHQALFVPEAWQRSLHAPPLKSKLGLALTPLLESLGAQLMALNGGAIVLRAVKQIYAPVGLAEMSALKKHAFSLDLPNAAPAG